MVLARPAAQPPSITTTWLNLARCNLLWLLPVESLSCASQAGTFSRVVRACWKVKRAHQGTTCGSRPVSSYATLSCQPQLANTGSVSR